MSKIKVQWPDGAYSTKGDDLSEPIQALLKDMHLLEEPPALIRRRGYGGLRT